jgi:RimJ/RimL family protein N-acetyltransferase
VIALRPYHPDFAPALFEAARESLAAVGPWMPWLHDGYALENARIWTERQQANFASGIEFDFMILDSSDRFLGAIGLNSVDLANPRANLGYWVRTSAQGRGVATEATHLIIEWAFANTPLVRLEVVISVENAASLRVAEKAGAVREGVLRSRILLHGRMHDAVLYAFIKPAVRESHAKEA